MKHAGFLIAVLLLIAHPGIVTAQQLSDATVVQFERGDQSESWALTIQANGQPIAHRREEAIAALFRFYDLNEDGQLNGMEAQTIASPAGLRQLPLGRMLPTMIPRPPEIDRDEDGLVTLTEFQAFYGASSKAGLWLTWGTTPRNDELNHALLQAMQIESHEKIDRERLMRGILRLSRLDTNSDELVSPGEILTGHIYPGITPTRLVSGGGSSSHSFGKITVTQGEASQGDHHWSIDLAEDGVTLQDGSNAQADALSSNSTVASARLHSAAADDSRAEAALADLASQFASSAGDDDQIRQSEVAGMQNQVDLENLIPLADANGDRTLTAPELAKWEEVARAYVRSVVVVTILDFEQNLFTALDTNFDGSLSLQELEEAWSTLQAAGAIDQGHLAPRQLSRQLRFVISQGPCQQLLDRGTSQGPPWFQAMDRNRDGQVSPDEFPAAAEKFHAMDRDGDGFLSLGDVSASPPAAR